MAEKMTDALLSDVSDIAAGEDSKVANVAAGSQLGLGANLKKLDAITPLVLPPIIPIVTHTPTLFSEIPSASAIWKALVERHSRSITGIDFGYTLETATTPVGHDGQEISVPTQTKRTTVTPSIVFPEGIGNIAINFHKMWMNLINDADTNASRLSSVLDDGSFDPMVYSSYTTDICFIQPDITMHASNMIDCFFVTAMFPTDIGTYGFQKEIGTSTIQERTITYSQSVVQHNRSTFNAGVEILRALNLHKVDYNNVAAIATAVESSISDQGLAKELEDISAEISG